MSRRGSHPEGAPEGLVVIDKAEGPSSHDVVARVRRLAGTRRVGHAGTLDPMATGVLVLGLGRGTKLLGHLALTEKAYRATVRLGAQTTTDDAQGELLATADASGVVEEALVPAMAGLTGEIDQVPSSVSAIKVDGKRAYALARAGEQVELAARRVMVSRFDVLAVRPVPADPETGLPALLDVDVEVECSSGTYVRALARDLGSALGVGGHLTALRRTRVGPYGLEMARTLEQLEEHLDVVPLAPAAAAAFPRRDVDPDAARVLSHGGRLPALGQGPGPVAVFAPDGALLALVEESRGAARPLVVLTPDWRPA
ncbi:MAG: tRNA pseudouridine(55) synthase TruB [Motilibacteraceae bacterium]